MTSSTSSSEASGIRRELPVLLMVACVLLVTESAMRLMGTRLSRDLVQIQAIPAIAEELVGHSPQQVKILFMGNSLIREGVVAPLIEEQLCRTLHGPISVRRVTTDATGIPEWYYAFKQFFADAACVPDILILGFEGDGGGHLSDQRQVFPNRLGQHFCQLADVPEAFEYDVKSLDQRVDFLAASMSCAYANRDRIQKRVLDLMIPDYQSAARHMNAMMANSDKGLHKQAETEVVPEFHRLSRMIALAEENKVRLIFVAMPVPRQYSVDPALVHVASVHGIPLIDGRAVPGISADMFPDGYHMNQSAATTFSDFLAEQLASSEVAIFDSAPDRKSKIRLVGYEEPSQESNQFSDK